MKKSAALLALFVLHSVPAATPTDQELTEAVVTAPEPRYVAPTTRDRIGRVWVPVLVDGHGPFRLVLDTGALRSAVTETMAQRLGAPLDDSPPVMLHGTTGSMVTPTIRVDSLQVGDLQLPPSNMPIVADAFGGAEGLLGIDGMQNHRIFIDFRHDRITISRSRNSQAPVGFDAIRFLPDPHHLLVVRAKVGNVPVRAIIDTGAQGTVGNLALQEALRKRLRRNAANEQQVEGATGQWQMGINARIAPIRLGDLQIRNAQVTFADLHIFNRWDFDEEPVLLIGMDIIGLVDQLVIDYRRHELQIKAPVQG